MSLKIQQTITKEYQIMLYCQETDETKEATLEDLRGLTCNADTNGLTMQLKDVEQDNIIFMELNSELQEQISLLKISNEAKEERIKSLTILNETKEATLEALSELNYNECNCDLTEELKDAKQSNIGLIKLNLELKEQIRLLTLSKEYPEEYSICLDHNKKYIVSEYQTKTDDMISTSDGEYDYDYDYNCNSMSFSDK